MKSQKEIYKRYKKYLNKAEFLLHYLDYEFAKKESDGKLTESQWKIIKKKNNYQDIIDEIKRICLISWDLLNASNPFSFIDLVYTDISKIIELLWIIEENDLLQEIKELLKMKNKKNRNFIYKTILDKIVEKFNFQLNEQ